MAIPSVPPSPEVFTHRLTRWAQDLGFQAVGVSGIDIGEDAAHLHRWLTTQMHGDMTWMAHHREMRTQPQRLVPGTLRVISVAMNYHHLDESQGRQALREPRQGYIAQYARGRDYHTLIRKRLVRLAERIAAEIGPLGYRVFTDSAPVLERALARDAGLGWIGKHTCLIDRRHGSWFFLGEIYVDFPLPISRPASAHCGTCTRCIDICPTRAIVAPYRLDARRCIAYLTIEHEGPIPLDLRPLIGNRIFGCDDCQLICPWNKFARMTAEIDFFTRTCFKQTDLIELFLWDETQFLARTAGNPVRRSGYERWLRNIAVALGNAPPSEAIHVALTSKYAQSSPLVRDHIAWALERQHSSQ